MTKVYIWKCARSNIEEVKEFDTYEKAAIFVKGFNNLNDKEEVPDWYMYARIV